jgi:hypothetical protein
LFSQLFPYICCGTNIQFFTYIVIILEIYKSKIFDLPNINLDYLLQHSFK